MSQKKERKLAFPEPRDVVRCFYDSLFGHVRNWPRAYACLTAEARNAFESERGLISFADYWEDKISLLEEIVNLRHKELPYSHSSCFTLDQIDVQNASEHSALAKVEIVETHLSTDRLMVVQNKELTRQERDWLLTNGELEGSLDEIIIHRGLRRRRFSQD